MITVRIPTPLRPMTGGKSEVEGTGASIGELIEQLNAAHPGLKRPDLRRTGRDSAVYQYLPERGRHPVPDGQRHARQGRRRGVHRSRDRRWQP